MIEVTRMNQIDALSSIDAITLYNIWILGLKIDYDQNVKFLIILVTYPEWFRITNLR